MLEGISWKEGKVLILYGTVYQIPGVVKIQVKKIKKIETPF